MTDQPSTPVTDVSIVEEAPSGLRDFLSSLLSINDTGTYHEQGCPVCKSPKRDEAEEVWRKTPTYDKDRVDKAMAPLKASGETIGRDVALNHFHSHMGGEAELRKKEYIKRIERMGAVRLTTLDRLEFIMDAVAERIMAASSIVEGDKLTKERAEEIRSGIVNALARTSGTLFSLHADIEKEMEKQGNVVRIHKDSFDKAFDMAISSAKTEKERQIISQLLDNLTTNQIT